MSRKNPEGRSPVMFSWPSPWLGLYIILEDTGWQATTTSKLITNKGNLDAIHRVPKPCGNFSVESGVTVWYLIWTEWRSQSFRIVWRCQINNLKSSVWKGRLLDWYCRIPKYLPCSPPQFSAVHQGGPSSPPLSTRALSFKRLLQQWPWPSNS